MEAFWRELSEEEELRGRETGGQWGQRKSEAAKE